MELGYTLQMINKGLLLIILANGLIFLKSGLGKATDEKYIGSLSGTLAKFASKNPYPFYKSFLETVAIPNSQIFATLTMLGELFTGATLVLGTMFLLLNKKNKKSLVVTIALRLGLLVGVFLNLTFWLAAGYTSASTDSLNLLMVAIGLIGLVYTSKLTA